MLFFDVETVHLAYDPYQVLPQAFLLVPSYGMNDGRNDLLP